MNNETGEEEEMNKNDKLVWVEIESNKGVGQTWTYRGAISSKVFEALVSNKLTDGFLKLEQVYWFIEVWIDDEGGRRTKERPTRLGYDGKYKNMTGEIFIRVDTIVTVLPMKDDAGSNLDLEMFFLDEGE
jgi:hypothetical protein